MTVPFVKTELGADPVIVEGFFAASPHSVFRAWTDPSLIIKWFGPEPGTLLAAEVDLRVGGAWRFVMRDDGMEVMGFEGEYLVISPDSRLVFTWSKFATSSSLLGDAPISRVEVILSENGSGTNICIVHSAIDDRETRIGFSGGWEHGMENLSNLLMSVTGVD